MLSPASARLPMARNCAASPDAAGHGGRPFFQGGDTFFQYRRGGIGQAGVDVSKFFQGKTFGSVLRVVEYIGSGLVDGNGAGMGGAVRCLSGMDLQGVEMVLFLVHDFKVMNGLYFWISGV